MAILMSVLVRECDSILRQVLPPFWKDLREKHRLPEIVVAHLVVPSEQQIIARVTYHYIAEEFNLLDFADLRRDWPEILRRSLDKIWTEYTPWDGGQQKRREDAAHWIELRQFWEARAKHASFLHYSDGLSYAEVGRRLGITGGRVKQLLTKYHRYPPAIGWRYDDPIHKERSR